MGYRGVALLLMIRKLHSYIAEDGKQDLRMKGEAAGLFGSGYKTTSNPFQRENSDPYSKLPRSNHHHDFFPTQDLQGLVLR